MKRNEIRANVLWDWDAKARRMRWAKGDKVKLCARWEKCQAHVGDVGHIIAVSCTDIKGKDGQFLIRNNDSLGGHSRMFTRYYVEFANGDVVGCHSHYLDVAEPPVEFGDWK